MSYCIVLKTAH